MDRKQVISALKKVREGKKRKFKQSVDFILNLTNMDLKNPKNRFTELVELPNGSGRDAKITVIADGDALVQAKAIADTIIGKNELGEWKDKKKIKKLADKTDFFIVQAHLMQPIATTLGPVLGPRGKMPHPKNIVPPVADIKPVVAKAKKNVYVRLRESPVIQVKVGSEEMDDEKIADNTVAVYSFIEKKLPKGKDNVKNSYLKFTMGPAVKIG